MLLAYNVYKFGYYVGMRSAHVVVLVQVGGEVVQARLALYDNQFPVATAHSDLVGLVELPVEMVVLQLLGIVAEERRSDYEFRLPRPSYMWNTLQRLSADYPEREFTLLIGADNWTVFDRWYHAADIIAHYPIAIYPRTGSPIDTSTLPPTVRLYDTGLYDISSTEVREKAAHGEDVSQLVPTEIVDDVKRHYGC